MPVREELHRITMGLPKKKSNNHHQRQGHRQRRPETVNSLCVVIHIHIQYLNSFVCVSMIIQSNSVHAKYIYMNICMFRYSPRPQEYLKNFQLSDDEESEDSNSEDQTNLLACNDMNIHILLE